MALFTVKLSTDVSEHPAVTCWTGYGSPAMLNALSWSMLDSRRDFHVDVHHNSAVAESDGARRNTFIDHVAYLVYAHRYLFSYLLAICRLTALTFCGVMLRIRARSSLLSTVILPCIP